MVADLMREYGLKVEEIINGGYFKAHRLWDVLNEIKTHNLFEAACAITVPHMNEEGRTQFFESLKERQPRRYPRLAPQYLMPPEVWEKFKKDFENA